MGHGCTNYGGFGVKELGGIAEVWGLTGIGRGGFLDDTLPSAGEAARVSSLEQVG
jgi:hypothetical protein